MITAMAVKGAVHGVVGGALSVAQGGTFMDGFAANAIGGAAGYAAGESGMFGQSGSPDGLFARTAIAATAGGLAAELTGGKFANGAITAGFAHLFNNEGAWWKQQNEQHTRGVEDTASNLAQKGWTVLPDREVNVIIPGFGLRRYDLLVQDALNFIYGVEVKTTRIGIIKYVRDQIDKDAALVVAGGFPSINGSHFISGVKYEGIDYSGALATIWKGRNLEKAVESLNIELGRCRPSGICNR